MAGELWFYHLERSTVEATLPALLEKCLERGWRALVVGGAPERLEALDDVLWTYREDSFLPHSRDGADAARQPILLTARLENLNAAKAVFLLDGAPVTSMEGVERTVVMFDGRDETALSMARAAWKEAKAAGRAVSYWKQDDSGKFAKQGG